MTIQEQIPITGEVIRRRDFIRRGLIVGWSTPIILTLMSEPAFACVNTGQVCRAATGTGGNRSACVADATTPCCSGQGSCLKAGGGTTNCTCQV